MTTILDRALAARRESRRVEFKESLDVNSEQGWLGVIKDLVALANSGGGVILFGVDKNGQPTGADVSVIAGVDPDVIADRLHQYVDSYFSAFEIVAAQKDGRPVVALIVGEAITPIVFTKSGTYATADGKQKAAFTRGAVYFRHGGKSEPGTTEDLAEAIGRRVEAVRKAWLGNVTRAIRSPIGPAMPVLPPVVRDSESPEATPIRIVDDPHAPAYRVVDYDKTHPFRQKELLNAFRAERSDLKINQFDLQAVRYAHGIDANVEFSHKTLFGTRQYSTAFLKWLLDQANADPDFFAKARSEYAKRAAPTN